MYWFIYFLLLFFLVNKKIIIMLIALLSARLFWYWTRTQAMITWSILTDSTGVLNFTGSGSSRTWQGSPRPKALKEKGWAKLWFFVNTLQLFLKRCKITHKLLLIINRKLPTHVPPEEKSVTLDDGKVHLHSIVLCRRILELIGANWMIWGPYYQR